MNFKTLKNKKFWLSHSFYANSFTWIML